MIARAITAAVCLWVFAENAHSANRIVVEKAHVQDASGQTDTLVFEPLSGNYLVRYVAHLEFVRTSTGTRPYDKDIPLAEGEELIQVDSHVVVMFEPATKVIPGVRCTVEREPGSDALTYTYEVSSGSGSKQRLAEFVVEFDKEVSVSDRTPKDGWHSLRENERRGDSLIPGWRWVWWAELGLRPKRSWNVGRLQARSLPGIVNCYFQGKNRRGRLSRRRSGIRTAQASCST